MAGAFTAVDLSQLPIPDAVETLDFETILAEMLADLQDRDPSFDAIVESDPAFKVLEVAAYRELLLRQRVNDAVKAVSLALGAGADLDHTVARVGVERLLLDPGDPDAVPPVPPTYELDDDLRRRAQLAPEGFSVAGPSGAYKFHALSSHADVLDVSVQRGDPGDIIVTVLSRVGDGIPSVEVLDAVTEALSDEDVRPLNDTVIVQAAENVDYTIEAELSVFAGPDKAVVLADAQAAAERYAQEARRLGRDITLSGVYGALQRAGVHRVTLTAPAADVPVSKVQAGRCTSIALTAVASDD